MLYSLVFFISSVYAFDTVSSLVLRAEQEGNRKLPIGWREGEKAKPSPIMRMKPEYFDYPGLKDILSAISDSRKLDDQGFQIKSPGRKRQIDRENQAAFSLRVNPVIPRNPLSVRNYSKVCHEKKVWCAELPTPKPRICPAVDTPTPIPPTCGPTKPPISTGNYIYCNFERSNNPVGHDPCDECPATSPPTTEYVACVSLPAPTAFARLRFCNPTTSKCHEIPCTYRSVPTLQTEPPPTPPRCDIGSLVDVRNPDSRFYILVKRSPGNWRPKRARPRRRFRIVSETI
ncbi:uncharacterized protein [Halyomorpha halys]|uniref:uncharacterized protein n=1 Tax=Halyomorpha halys TaxID=286706 RepID=UPI0006D50C9F|nr:uncharacterized protein LOC106677304 [Halyomorpha halys]